ncbi:MAG: DUF4325 domain-containing protein [Patescibacteria group bacterium]
MDIERLIISRLSKKKELRIADLIGETGFSRAYLNRFLKKLREEGKIVLMGRANQTRYVSASRLPAARRAILATHKILDNSGLSEDIVLDNVKKETGIFLGLPERIARMVDYAFTEMLNNAIEHSKSKKIEIVADRNREFVSFTVLDRGVGIFRNIMKKRKLKNELEAVQDLLKGKQTTAPRKHSGEGIFFTSKVADVLTIYSGRKVLSFNNMVDDVFVSDRKNPVPGTKVYFLLNLHSKKTLEAVFGKYTDNAFEFDRTEAKIKLYKLDSDFISRSQARRVLSGLEKFGVVTLDFSDVETVGQGFADEVFRVWGARYPKVKIIPKNYNENIAFMIHRAGSTNFK